MKNSLLLLLLAFFIGNALSQNDYKELILIVEKKPINSQTSRMVRLEFKPGKVLQFKTLDGRKLTTNKYFLLDSSKLILSQYGTVINQIDTIALQDIISIRGKVYGNIDRKILGSVVALSSIPLGFFSVFFMTMGATTVDGTPPAMLIAMPFVGMFGVGVSMTGARRFNTTDKWDVKIIEK